MAAWDFPAMALSQPFHVERASSAYGYDAAGRFVSSAPDRLRRDCSGALPAALFEPARTNLLSHAAVGLSRGWSLSGATAQDLQLGALGVFPGCEVASAGASWNRLIHTARPGVTAGSTYRITLWVRFGSSGTVFTVLRDNATGSESHAGFTPGGGSVYFQEAGTISDLAVTRLGVDGAHRLELSFVPAYSGELNLGAGPGSDTAGLTVTLLGAQVEESAEATSLILSDGSPATRAADLGNWGAPEGTWDLRCVAGDGGVTDILGVSVGAGWSPGTAPYSVARVLLYPAGTL